MRIIAGTAKGRKLSTPKGGKERFTSDKVKGSLFNILGQDLSGKSFLDLFAGAGNVGIEALSRGASTVIFVEKKRSNADIIRKNLKTCRLEEKAKVYNLPFEGVLDKLPSSFFDYIFLDPPYNLYNIEFMLQELQKHDIITQFATLIVEHSKKDIAPKKAGNLVLIRDKFYGETVLSFYKLKSYPNEKNCSLSR